jgi:Sec-independent protein translocase protein TatA
MPQLQKQLADLIREFSKMMTDFDRERKDTLKNSFKNINPSPGTPVAFGAGKNSWGRLPQSPEAEAGADRNNSAIQTIAANMENIFAQLVHPEMVPRGDIPVNRDKYEAMIYELGRLKALQKCNTQITREASLLKARMESQRQAEIDYLRQMLLEKKPKKWW